MDFEASLNKLKFRHLAGFFSDQFVDREIVRDKPTTIWH